MARRVSVTSDPGACQPNTGRDRGRAYSDEYCKPCAGVAFAYSDLYGADSNSNHRADGNGNPASNIYK